MVPPLLLGAVSGVGSLDPDRPQTLGPTDAANAFPSLRLECIVDALREGCPELLWWFHFTYGGDGALQFDSKGVEYVRAQCLRQGSVLASLFFGLLLACVIKNLLVDNSA